MSLYICTTVGGTRYLREWLASVINLRPSTIAVARDVDRSEPLECLPNLHVLEYSSGKKWVSYEKRHLNFESDYSILLGIIKLIEFFLRRGETHFIHIDSDVIVSRLVYYYIYPLSWDYLQFTTPVVPREAVDTTHVKPILFYESTNFGVSKQIARQLSGELQRMLDNPYPVDINIHKVIRGFSPFRHRLVKAGVSHYIKGVKYTI